MFSLLTGRLSLNRINRMEFIANSYGESEGI